MCQVRFQGFIQILHDPPTKHKRITWPPYLSNWKLHDPPMFLPRPPSLVNNERSLSQLAWGGCGKNVSPLLIQEEKISIFYSQQCRCIYTFLQWLKIHWQIPSWKDIFCAILFLLALKQSWDFFLQYCGLPPLITVEDRHFNSGFRGHLASRSLK